MVSEMVADTENSVTDFLQGAHVKLEEPKMDLDTSLRAMEETMASLKLGTAAGGVETPSQPEGVVSATDVPMDAGENKVEKGNHKWSVFGRARAVPTTT